jgi:hypothetical protein
MRDRVPRLCLYAYPLASRERDGRAIVDLASELSTRSPLAFIREASGVLKGGVRARGRDLRRRLTGDPRERRDTYLGMAAILMTVGYLLSVSAMITVSVRNGIDSAGGALVLAGEILLVCGVALLALGFAVIAAAFFSSVDARDTRLRRGTLILAGGYALGLVSGVLSLLSVYRSPDVPLQAGTILYVAAYLPLTVAALLVASAFAGPRHIRETYASARNRRLGWAGIAFGVDFALTLSRFVASSPGWTWIAAQLAAVVAMGVAAAGFFRAARGLRLGSPGALPRRDGALAVAATLFLLYRVLELSHVGIPAMAASWLWGLDSVALTLAALLAAAGMVGSRKARASRDPLKTMERRWN